MHSLVSILLAFLAWNVLVSGVLLLFGRKHYAAELLATSAGIAVVAPLAAAVFVVPLSWWLLMDGAWTEGDLLILGGIITTMTVLCLGGASLDVVMEAISSDASVAIDHQDRGEGLRPSAQRT